MFSGQMEFKVLMKSNDWKNIFDSSVLPSPKLVHGRGDTVIFVSENDTIHAMGKKLFNPDLELKSHGWLHTIKKPDECVGIIKIISSKHFRVLLTQNGRLFIWGKEFSQESGAMEEDRYDWDQDFIQLIDGVDEEDAEDQF